MDFGFLGDLVIVFALGGLVVYALRAFGLPAIVGLLLSGAAVGPHGLSLVNDVHRVEVLAEIGVVLLLFTIGLEFSLAQLMKMWRLIVIGGGAQVLLCITAIAAVAIGTGSEPGPAVFFGFLASLSSTAIVLRLLGDRAQLGAPFGRISLGVLLFQDLCIVPLMLFTPFLAGRGSGAGELALTLLKAAGVIAGVLLAARWLVPPVLSAVVKARSRELFLTLLLVLCLGTAWLTSLAGLSLALGAFLAGLSISESEYSHQAMAEAIPFRDAFGSLFFISIGMLMDVGFVVRNVPLVAAAILVILVVKALTAGIPVLFLGYPLHVAVQVAFALSQVGEFAFVLSRSGLELGLMDDKTYQAFLSASVLTMLLTPPVLALGGKLAARLPQRALPIAAEPSEGASSEPLEDHVVIAGYGVNGQNLARALTAAGVQFAILEMNPETVRAARSRSEPIHYGDCTRAAVLSSVGIERARLYVVAISDAASTRQSVVVARNENPDLYIIVRTRFVAEIDELRKLGADEVVPEEFETSVELFARVLTRFEIPRNLILELVSRVRGDMYEMLRGPPPIRHSIATGLEALSDLRTERLLVNAGSPAVGQSLAELEVRAKTGALVLAVQRGPTAHTNPDADFRFAGGDVLLMMGTQSALDAALSLLDPTAPLV